MKTSLIMLVGLLLLSCCGYQSSSNKCDRTNDTIPIIHQNQDFGEAVDSLAYKGMWSNDCDKCVVYVMEEKTGRMVAHSSLVRKGQSTDTGVDFYRETVKRGLSDYVSHGDFKKSKITGVHDNISFYSRTQTIRGDSIRMEACCFYPEEYPLYEIFISMEKSGHGQTVDAEKMCDPVIDDIIFEITGEMAERQDY